MLPVLHIGCRILPSWSPDPPSKAIVASSGISFGLGFFSWLGWWSRSYTAAVR